MEAKAKRRPLAARIAEELRQKILAGRFQPGERLIEDRLSEEFAVSRIPIREALRTLIADGLVVPTKTRGTRVAGLTIDDARDLIEVRAILEGFNARLAARRRHPEVLARIRTVLHAGGEAARSADPEELARLNGEFHDLLAEAGANSVLQDIMRTLRERTELVFRRNTAERAARDWQEHAAILSAVADGDGELAALLATRHVRRAGEERLALLQTDSAP